jgi:hypothetical protein
MRIDGWGGAVRFCFDFNKPQCVLPLSRLSSAARCLTATIFIY